MLTDLRQDSFWISPAASPITLHLLMSSESTTVAVLQLWWSTKDLKEPWLPIPLTSALTTMRNYCTRLSRSSTRRRCRSKPPGAWCLVAPAMIRPESCSCLRLNIASSSAWLTGLIRIALTHSSRPLECLQKSAFM